ncbi:MAG: LysE family translocator [Deltaproteobacteria bacterium]
MDLTYFIKGFVVGIVITAPVGPVGALIVQRTINNGRFSGMVSGVGASVGDAVYAVIAAFGLTFISGLIAENEVWVRVIGGIILLVFGVRVYSSRPPSYSEPDSDVNHFGTFGSAFLLTLSNPIVILSILALFAILGVTKQGDYYRAASILVLGIFAGCLFLWTALCWVVANLRGRIGERGLSYVNKITGIFILACGVYAFLSILGIQAA